MIHSIPLFGVAVKGNSNPMLQRKVAIAAAKLGYIINPDCATVDTLKWLESQQADFNSTFYKTLEDVTSKNRYELFIDQLMHYATTYGTNFALGNGYVPNDGEHPEFDFSEYKYIDSVLAEDLYERCYKLACSGIAMSNELCDYLVDNICEYVTLHDDKLEVIAAITNREVKAKVYDKMGLAPLDKFELIRFISQKQTGSAMIIQSNDVIRQIKLSSNKFDFTTLTGKQIVNLSSIFLRYKNWLLAFKNKKNAPILNRMRRLAKSTHTPLKPGFWDTVLHDMPAMDEVVKHLDELDPFRKVRLFQACMERIKLTTDDKDKKRIFLIRNQKLYWKDNDLKSQNSYYVQLAFKIARSFKRVKVKLPKNFRLAMPSSEKSFIGNLPAGTQFKFPEQDGFLGIYWRNEWGTRDFDLHFFDPNGCHIGWNSGYYNQDQSIVFSGDMTNADPEATEIMFFKSNCPEGVAVCNRYNGDQGSRFDLILGSEEPDKSKKYMVDPNNIQFRAECTSDSRETTCGYVKDNKFTLMSFYVGNRQVSSNAALINVMARKADSFLYLDEVFEVVADDYEGDDYVDLTGEISKDTIINLMVQ